ncbi:MAG: hypothetical protein U0R27_13460 [Candidatus Nanopelagicales bacterium]|nr:MAG: hypothetical protein E6Q90_00100 [Actinomycetota bacterium]HNE88660.1 hypothetical protein [Actinomycetota bacterium]HNL51437.1 hypothetical protein [Actinomycetota bacterium]HNO15577.1 hypothetical protein [Actinomycetota bacterium]HUM86788.1 hypothetical protein [Actinomycetota bacterium]
MSMGKVVAMGATVAVASGVVVMGAGAANAAGDPDFKKVSAPATVVSGQMFRIKCQLKKNVNWSGAMAQLDQKKATINAKREVSANGNCSMRVILGPTGKQKIRVIVTQNGGAFESKWLTIKVKPAT